MPTVTCVHYKTRAHAFRRIGANDAYASIIFVIIVRLAGIADMYQDRLIIFLTKTVEYVQINNAH